MVFPTIDPRTGEVIRTYEHFTDELVHSKVELAKQKFAQWKMTSWHERSLVLVQLAKILGVYKNDLAQSISMEIGKTQEEAIGEVEKSILTCEYFAQNESHFLASEAISVPVPTSTSVSNQKCVIVKDPLGPLLAIMPWNFPLWQVIRFAVPALAGGNVILLKHSDLVAGTAELIEKVFSEASGGKRLLQNLRINHEQTHKLISNHYIRGVTFTGSRRGGQEIAKSAARSLKKCVLELGGSDAYIVLPDADLDKAAAICAQSRLINQGQSCISAKRILVHQDILASFKDRFIAQMKKYNPKSPLAHKKFKHDLTEQVDQLVYQGARILWTEELDAKRSDIKSAYYPMQVIECNSTIKSAFTEEFFGPVALLFSFHSDEEAIELANASIYGLGAAIFTQNRDKGRALGRWLECGMVAINDFVRSSPMIPFGGVKDSGYGRELSHYGILEFMNIKSMTFGEASS